MLPTDFTDDDTPMSHDSQTLAQIAEIRGQLTVITQMIQHNHEATHQRIDDLRHAVEGRLSGVETRVGRLEENERGTAMKASTAGAVSGLLSSVLVAAGIAAVKGIK